MLRMLVRLTARALIVLVAVVLLSGAWASVAAPARAGLAEDGARVAAANFAQAPARPKGYWDKHHLYHVLDALILSSPITGIIAIVLFLDPDVRQRPDGVFRKASDGLEISPRYRKRLMMKLGGAITCAVLCALGVLTYVFHLLDLIPRI
ncbi:hypothetical protein L6R52_17950 [Myxococcota bacterium]|nr:hypothetical protein [Myxococcota bacterium]